MDAELWKLYRQGAIGRPQIVAPAPPDVWKRMQHASDYSISGGDLKSSIETMIQSHKNAIEGLQTILALANMAAATKNPGIERFISSVIFGGLAAMREGKLGDFG